MLVQARIPIPAIIFALWMNPAAIPPLSEVHRTALETAFDGRDHREAAFDALVEHARQWSGEIGDALIRLDPDVSAMIAEPDAYRGDLCRIEGRIDQIEWLRDPWLGAASWFVRLGDGTAVLVFLVSSDDGGMEGASAFRVGDHVTLTARFYKRLDAVARDGDDRAYGAFVGSMTCVHPVQPAGSDTPVYLLVMAASIGFLVVFFVAAFLIARRARSRASINRPVLSEPDDAPDALDLPDSPAEALQVLDDLARRGG